jgi:hypothetical protein
VWQNNNKKKEKKMSNVFYKKRSLGGLREVSQTNPKAPRLIGSMTIEAETLKVLVRQLNESGGDKVISNLAGWVNRDANGKFLTVEISPRYAKNPTPMSPQSTLERFSPMKMTTEKVACRCHRPINTLEQHSGAFKCQTKILRETSSSPYG